MPVTLTPLRYPGGKTAIAPFLSAVMQVNEMRGVTYVEPYAGGAGAAISLLLNERVDRIRINDADRCVLAFWRAVLAHTQELIERIARVRVGISEWRRQKRVYLHPRDHSMLDVGFATFFLNRCNRSGILLKAGPIGGRKQTGKWKIGARFNKKALIAKVERIAAYTDRIDVSNLDALEFLALESNREDADRAFVYLDPPYYASGSDLYLNHYSHDDHQALAGYLSGDTGFRWIMSYDGAEPIRKMYAGMRVSRLNLRYSANEHKPASEVLICRHDLLMPRVSPNAKALSHRRVDAPAPLAVR